MTIVTECKKVIVIDTICFHAIVIQKLWAKLRLLLSRSPELLFLTPLSALFNSYSTLA